MKQYSFLSESIQFQNRIYHYEESLSICKEILNSGSLLSASYIGNKDNKYDSRASKFNGQLDKYFKDRYDKFYKQVLKKEYNGDYGIYFSPTDMFNMDLPLKYLQSYRFNIDIKQLFKNGFDIIWQVGRLGPYNKKILKKINSVSDYLHVYNDYKNRIESEEKEIKIAVNDNIKYKKLIFLRLPQIIVFAGKNGIQVHNNQLEKK